LGEATDSSTFLLKECPALTDKVEIKCMGSVGGKTPTEPKDLFILSLTLDTLDKTKLIFCILFIYSMGD
jgi:hypothetical protein